MTYARRSTNKRVIVEWLNGGAAETEHFESNGYWLAYDGILMAHHEPELKCFRIVKSTYEYADLVEEVMKQSHRLNFTCVGEPWPNMAKAFGLAETERIMQCQDL